jgi:hypothetical protein
MQMVNFIIILMNDYEVHHLQNTVTQNYTTEFNTIHIFVCMFC